MNLLDDYLTEQQLAEQLDKTPRTLQSWRQRRCGPPWTILGKTVFYRKDAFIGWLRSLEQQPVRSQRTSRVSA